MSKYPWAENVYKLQRAIARANQEGLSLSEKEARIKELYISSGGKLISTEEEKVELPEIKENKHMSEEEKVNPEESVDTESTDVSETIPEETKTDTEFSDTAKEEGKGTDEE